MILAIMIYFQGFGIAFLQSASIDPMPWWIWTHFWHSIALVRELLRDRSPGKTGLPPGLGFIGSDGAVVAACAADAWSRLSESIRNVAPETTRSPG